MANSAASSSLIANASSPSTQQVSVQIGIAVGVVVAILVPMIFVLRIVYLYSRGHSFPSIRRQRKANAKDHESIVDVRTAEYMPVPAPAYLLPATPTIQAMGGARDLPDLKLPPAYVSPFAQLLPAAPVLVGSVTTHSFPMLDLGPAMISSETSLDDQRGPTTPTIAAKHKTSGIPSLDLGPSSLSMLP